MRAIRRPLRVAATIAAAALLAVATVPVEAGHARTRPTARGASGTAGSGAARTTVGTATRGRASAAVRVTGQARYGHGGGSRVVVGWGGYGGWPWWYGSGLDVGLWWGWPVYGWYPVSYPYPIDSDADPAVRDFPGRIETDVRPRRADVWLDGTFVGQARDFSGRWDALYLDRGPHELRFERDGYRTLTVHVDVRAAATHRIDFALQKGEGDDPRSSAAPAAPAVNPGVATTVDGMLRDDRVPRPALRTGRLRIDVSPADAAVYLDGEFLARAGEIARLHGALPVAAGEHTIEVVRPGFESVSRTIVVGDSGEAVVVEIELHGDRD